MSNQRPPDGDPHAEEQCVLCELREGIFAARGRVWSYYRSRQGRSPMLVLDRTKGQRLRIDGAVDVAVLDVHNGEVTLSIQIASDQSRS